jgi:hypothetical protein
LLLEKSLPLEKKSRAEKSPATMEENSLREKRAPVAERSHTPWIVPRLTGQPLRCIGTEISLILTLKLIL